MASPTIYCACRVHISAVGIVTSMKLRTPLIHNGIVAQNRVVLEAPTQMKDLISQSETFLGEGIYVTNKTRLWSGDVIRTAGKIRLSCVAHFA